MSDTTPNQGFPFPEENDPPAGHSQMEALATDLDNKWPIRSKGKSIISAEQSITSTSASLAGTPDIIEDLVLPTDGLLMVGVHLQMRVTDGSSPGSGFTRLYLNENIVHIADGTILSVVKAELNTTDPNVDGLYKDVHSFGGGLHVAKGFSSNVVAPITTGQVIGGRKSSSFETDDTVMVGGLLAIFAAAGTYDLSLRYGGPGFGGNVSVKNRKLWAWTMPF